MEFNMDALKENYKALRANEEAHELLYANLADSLEAFKHAFLDELAKFKNDKLQESSLEIKYEDSLIKMLFEDGFSRSGENRVMKTVDGSIAFKVYLDDPCTDRDFDTVSNALYNILGVAVVY